MKVLLISDNQDNVDYINSFFSSRGYDVIVYKWIIKAIDNIEEIRPDIIIVSAAEYPRHWKTLASFVQSGIGGDNIKIYLYEPEALSLEEEKKVAALGVEGCFTSFNDECFGKFFAEIGSTAQKELNSQIIITNPKDCSLLTGNVISIKDDVYVCKLNSVDLGDNHFIEQCSVANGGKVTFFNSRVSDIDTANNTLSLTVCEYYEEK